MKFLMITIFSIIIFSTTLIPIENIYAEKTIDLQIKYTNGDRADFNSMKVLIFQDFNSEPLFEKELKSNPDFISLPENHRYKIEVYANEMYADVGYVELKNQNIDLDIVIPLSAGLQFEVFYKDGQTPIKDATVVLKSQDNSEWARSITNDQGETTRHWIQSTVKQEDHYVAEVYLESLFLTSYSPIKLLPGSSTTQKIITEIPEYVEKLITFNLYEGSKLIKSTNGDYKIILSDLEGNDMEESSLNFRGDVQFSNIKSGTYVVKIIGEDENENKLWPQTEIHILGDIEKFNIFKNSQTLVDEISPFQSCNCISFRLDDVQDYWLAETQIEIIDLFSEKNIPLTVGVIGSIIGTDERITDILKENLDENNVEIANHSWNNDVLENLDENTQEEFILKTNEKIFEVYGVTPVSFIPPENKFDEKTVSVLKKNNFTHLSAHIVENDFPQIHEDSFFNVPSVTETAILLRPSLEWQLQDIEKIKNDISQSISKNGYAVIMMHPQEFSLNEIGEYDVPNKQTISNLSLLLDDVNEMNLNLVTISQIQPKIENTDNEIIDESPIEGINEVGVITESCNCVAFRLNDVQDYWLNQVQINIMDVFIQNNIPLTVGIIADSFGNDQKITTYVQENLKTDNVNLEIASKGIGLTAYTELDKDEQNENLKKSLDLIESNTGIRPQVFIPPQNKFDEKTFSILQENNITHISSSLINGDSPPFEFESVDVYRFPQTTSTGKFIHSSNMFEGVSSHQTFNEAVQSVTNFGFAVISIQAQEFSNIENSTYVNTVNLKQIEELQKLIDELKDNKIKIVPIGKINSNLITNVPEWIKNNAEWWANGSIDDKTFVQGIEYLVKNGIIVY